MIPKKQLSASRHNLTGQVTAMIDEDRIAHDRFSAALVQSLSPDGAMETQLAQRIASDSWRLNRASAIEDNLFAIGYSEHAEDETSQHPEVHAAFTAARVFTAQSHQLALLTLYEQRIELVRITIFWTKLHIILDKTAFMALDPQDTRRPLHP